MSETELTRAQILGNLIRDARLYAGQRHRDCAKVLGITEDEYKQAEAGEYSITLPDLEVLALYLRVPMGYFWGTDQLHEAKDVNYAGMLDLRQRVIGAMIRQLRLQARQTTADFAELLEVDEEVIQEYEAGSKPIPYLQLEQLCRHLDVSITHFVDDQHGPLRRHEAEQRLQKIFDDLDVDMQTFLANPTNVSYLETAKTLSEMDVQRLRQVAESLLEITF
jgi:transcriptional regulator with XRE-family HTH domain